MNMIGILMAKLLTQDCKFELENDSKNSALGSIFFFSCRSLFPLIIFMREQ